MEKLKYSNESRCYGNRSPWSSPCFLEYFQCETPYAGFGTGRKAECSVFSATPAASAEGTPLFRYVAHHQ